MSLDLAEQAAKENDYAAAEKYCKDHLEAFPSDRKARRLLAFIFSLDRRHADAIATVSEVLALSGDKSEPSDYFNRGRWHLERRDFSAAIADFSSVIELCGRYKDDYYLEAAYLHRGIAHMQTGSDKEARDDLSKVSDECQTFSLGKLFSKANLLEL
jgi:tetratricopeptide (TPR) repeat protein